MSTSSNAMHLLSTKSCVSTHVVQKCDHTESDVNHGGVEQQANKEQQ